MSDLRRPPERYAMPERRKTARGVPELTSLEGSMVARIRALEAERDELIEALSSVSEHNQHYGAGPHCTCSQRAREQIASDAIVKYAPRVPTA